MTRGEAVIWLTYISEDIGKAEHRDLWHYEQTLDEIKEMLEGEPERETGEWIPCSERLPEPDKRCLVTLPLIGGYPFVRILTYGHTEEGKLCWHEKDYDADIEMYGVTAWMPLPEPWKEGYDED